MRITGHPIWEQDPRLSVGGQKLADAAGLEPATVGFGVQLAALEHGHLNKRSEVDSATQAPPQDYKKDHGGGSYPRLALLATSGAPDVGPRRTTGVIWPPAP